MDRRIGAVMGACFGTAGELSLSAKQRRQAAALDMALRRLMRLR